MSTTNNVICLDIGGTTIKSGVHNGKQIVDICKTPTCASSLSGIKSAIIKALSLHKGNSVALSSAGDINAYSGDCIYATDNLMDYSGFKLTQFVTQNTGLPATAINDAQAALLAEATVQGLNQPTAMITLGTGIGGAFYNGKNIVFGNDFRFGRWGHINLIENGLKCNCGNIGCLEQYLSATALLKQCQNLEQEFANKDSVLVNWFVKNLALAAQKIYDMSAYKTLIIGGGVADSYATWLPILKQICPYNITIASLGNTAGMYGAYFWHRQVGTV